MKVVINECHGGFGLSKEGVLHYAKLKGLTVYPEKGKYSFETYWLVPKEERVKEIKDWYKATTEERVAYNNAYSEQVLNDSGISRHDPELVKTVEELGKAANGLCASLKVVEIPDGVDYDVQEYDGMESLHEPHRTWS